MNEDKEQAVLEYLDRIAKALETLAEVVTPGRYGGRVERDSAFRIEVPGGLEVKS